MVLPLVLPPTVLGYYLLISLGGGASPLGHWMAETFHVRLTFNFMGLVLASIVFNIPFLVWTKPACTRQRQDPRWPPVTWVIPGDGIAILDRLPEGAGEFGAEVIEARHLGEITLVTLGLATVRNARLLLTLSGPQRVLFTVGTKLGVRFNVDLVHVMPLRGARTT